MAEAKNKADKDLSPEEAKKKALAAALAHGTDLATALRWANVAGALTTTRFGPATCPSGAQIRALA